MDTAFIHMLDFKKFFFQLIVSDTGTVLVQTPYRKLYGKFFLQATPHRN